MCKFSTYFFLYLVTSTAESCVVRVFPAESSLVFSSEIVSGRIYANLARTHSTNAFVVSELHSNIVQIDSGKTQTNRHTRLHYVLHSLFTSSASFRTKFFRDSN